jgi:YegS/Rv2252/BmrU family lipid kinase
MGAHCPLPVAVIINPVSGTDSSVRRVARRTALAERMVQAHGCVPDVRVTAGPGHATVLAREAVARGARLVIAWGGDGTVNEVATALVGGPAALGIVRSGSGDGLARELGIDREPARALATALGGSERDIDAGEIGGRLFFNVAGVGADAWIAHRFNARGSNARRGLLVYGALVLGAVASFLPSSFRVTADGQPVSTDRAYLLTIANAPQFGNGVRIAPEAIMDDGALDLVILRARTAVEALWRARRLLGGGRSTIPGVSRTRASEIRIQSDRPIDFHVDGEAVHGGCELVARVRPGALKIRC